MLEISRPTQMILRGAPPVLSFFWYAIIYTEIIKTPVTKGSAIGIVQIWIVHEICTVVATTPKVYQ